LGYHILKNIEFKTRWRKWCISTTKSSTDRVSEGISGEDILLEARILAVSDVVEAMASHRPYRPSLGIETALEEITRGKGVLFDGTVVDTCVRLIRERKFLFSQEDTPFLP
jgi:HD-GYP domain-containing protein (c-di-GMP phosphodiesterase class II)